MSLPWLFFSDNVKRIARSERVMSARVIRRINGTMRSVSRDNSTSMGDNENERN